MGRNNEWAVSVLRVYERGVKQILWIVLLKVSEREGEAGVHRCKSCEIIFPPNFWEGEASLISFERKNVFFEIHSRLEMLSRERRNPSSHRRIEFRGHGSRGKDKGNV